jgi:hypothetical protein
VLATGQGADLSIEFNAFIPGHLGHSFASYPHPADLQNQAAFEVALAAVPGTWKCEPGPGGVSVMGCPWYYATDNREFGGGSHRVGFVGTIARADIGALETKPKVFTHSTSGSARVRWTHTGIVTSAGETGSVDGPYSKSASVTASEHPTDASSDESTVTTTGASSYPFSCLSPDIDYTLVFDCKRDPGGATLVQAKVTNNKFPFYELLINGKIVWKYASNDTDPSLINLNTSVDDTTDWFSF